jgi:hypothetical protein
VTVGRLIGRCGATGDASVPHVHFCLFAADGRAIDPMRALVRRLRTAERRLPPWHHRSEADGPPASLPAPGIASRGGSGGLPPPVIAAEPADRPDSASPPQGLVATAAFVLIFGSARWGSPPRRRRDPPADGS